MKESFLACTNPGTVSRDPCLAGVDEGAPGILAATVNSEHTLVIMQHVARSTDTALLAGGGDPVAGALAEALRVRAGR